MFNDPGDENPSPQPEASQPATVPNPAVAVPTDDIAASLKKLQGELLAKGGKSFASDVVALLLAMLADAPYTFKYPLPVGKLQQTIDLFGRNYTFTEALAGQDLIVTETPD